MAPALPLPDTKAIRRLSSALTAKARLRLSRVAPGRLHVSFHGAVSRYSVGNLHDHEQRLFQDLRRSA